MAAGKISFQYKARLAVEREKRLYPFQLRQRSHSDVDLPIE